ncbi:unnamed protein product [Paramecium octaurelia]|uniref:Uncharacterized protein n=1 Tax=Paramecium octaurelia TaxID=43137 RepID=A0A8S1X4G2_PAROT|nr:unnamed protein product [Paramecium octaurelia]
MMIFAQSRQVSKIDYQIKNLEAINSKFKHTQLVLYIRNNQKLQEKELIYHYQRPKCRFSCLIKFTSLVFVFIIQIVALSPQSESQQIITGYLCQAVLKLRDRNNLQQAIELVGTSNAIPICVLIAEIITTNSPGLSQITYFQKDNKTQDQQSSQIGIRIKLTYQPTESEMREPGFQQRKVDPLKQHNWDDLYKFILLYSKDLSMIKNHEIIRLLSDEKQMDQRSSYSSRHQSESHITKNNCDPNSFVYTSNHGTDDANRSKIKTRGQKRL